MKTILTLFSSGLVLVLSLGLAYAQSPSHPKTYSELSGQSWLTNYYGKTLSSLGEIITIRIERGPSASTSNTNRTYRALWEIIEHSKIQDYASMGVAVRIPPVFSIEYADGLHVRASRYAATITLPDGREGPVVLAEDSPNNGAPANRRSASPLAAGRQFGRALHAQPRPSAAVAELGCSAKHI